MARPKGSRNRGYDDRKAHLANLLVERLVSPEGTGSSFRELATAAGVSVATLRHYFGDRDGAVAAAMDAMREQGAFWLEFAAVPQGPLEVSLRSYLGWLGAGWIEFGVGAQMSAGMVLGTGHDLLGPAYVSNLLEPLLQAMERRLQGHSDELRADTDIRMATLALMSPVLVAFLHQDNFRGRECRPLDLEQFLESHLQGWLRSYRREDAQ